MIKVVLEIFVEKYTPATLTQVNGVRTLWLRYGEWLLTCPVSSTCQKLALHRLPPGWN